MGRHCALLRNDLLVLLRQLHRRDIDVTPLRRSGRANHPALVEQILADAFVVAAVTDTTDGYDRTFAEPDPSAQRVS